MLTPVLERNETTYHTLTQTLVRVVLLLAIVPHLLYATMQYCHCLLYWPGYIHVVTEVAQWEQGFVHGGRKSKGLF